MVKNAQSLFRIPRVVRAILLGHLIFLIATLIISVNAFGGINGNVPYNLHEEPDALLESRIVLNRWYLDPQRVPMILKIFMTLNLPSALVAWSFRRFLEMLFSSFQHAYPLGLSAGTYTHGLTFLLSPLQWLIVGYMLHWIARKRT